MQLDREDFWEAADTLETIAAVEHERWAHWQNYLHNQCNVRDDGSLVIPPDLAARWAHQMGTPDGDAVFEVIGAREGERS